jgi:hypothetical protein
MKPIYLLLSENLMGLGGPMGTERTWTNWRKYFYSKQKAKEYANADYHKHCPNDLNLKWYKTDKGCKTTDLGFVMYYIKELEIE